MARRATPWPVRLVDATVLEDRTFPCSYLPMIPRAAHIRATTTICVAARPNGPACICAAKRRDRTTRRPVSRRCSNVVSDSAGKARRDLLDEPLIAVGIIEGEERAVTRALGVQAAEPGLHGERRAVPHLTRVDAKADEFVMGCFDVGDNQPPFGRARRGRGYSLPERD